MVFLVIDDDASQREFLIESLKVIGYDQIIEAENGLDGYTKLKENKVDFIFSDWNMPVLKTRLMKKRSNRRWRPL